MTKKSLGRQERDRLASITDEQRAANTKQLAANVMPTNNWESLQALRNNTLALFQQYGRMIQALMLPEIQAQLTDLQYAANLVKSMNADIGMLLAKSETLYERHKDKHGAAKGDDEWFTIVGIFQEYGILFEEHQMLIQPVAFELNELLQAAAVKAQAANQAQAQQENLLDKDVTSDVAFTEVPATTEIKDAN